MLLDLEYISHNYIKLVQIIKNVDPVYFSYAWTRLFQHNLEPQLL